MLRRLTISALALPALLLALMSSSAPGGYAPLPKLGPNPPKMFLTSGGQTVRAVQGTFCWEDRKGSLCADSAYPLGVKCVLPANAGILKVRAAARIRGSVTVGLIVPDATAGFAESQWHRRKRSRAGRKTWLFQLPPEATTAIAVDVSVFGPKGDSDTWTGLATDACRSSAFGE